MSHSANFTILFPSNMLTRLIIMAYLLVFAQTGVGVETNISVLEPDGRVAGSISVRVFDQIEYLSLTHWSEWLETELDWDYITGVAEMRFRDNRLRFVDAGRGVWVNGRMHSLQGEVRQVDGDIWVPVKILDDLVDSLWEGDLVWSSSERVLRRFAKQLPGITPSEMSLDDGQIVVVLDAGHGGSDTGCLNVDGSKEKDITLRILNRVSDIIINRLGAQVVMTRPGDIDVTIDNRIGEANRSAADLFVSLHICFSEEIPGQSFAIYLLPPENEIAERAELELWGYRSESLIQRSKDMASRFAAGLSATSNVRSLGFESRRLSILKGLNMPAFMVELSWDASFYGSVGITEEGGRNRAAEAVFDGIRECLNLE